MTLMRTLSWTLALCTACGGGGDPPADLASAPDLANPPPADLATPQATLNIVHAATGASVVDIYLNGKLAVPALAYRKGTGNIVVDAGDYTIAVRPAGAPVNSAPVFSTQASLARDSKTLFVAYGRLADSGLDTAFTLKTFPFGAPDATAGQVRLIHASTGAPSMDIANGNSKVLGSTVAGSATSFSKLAADLPANTRLGLRPQSGSTDLVFATVPTALGKGAVVNLIAFGEINPAVPDDQFLAVSTLDEATGKLTDLTTEINTAAALPNVNVLFFHAAADVGNVDLGPPGAKLAANLGFRKSSTLVSSVRPGSTRLELRPANNATVTRAENLKLLPGMNWLVYVRGLASGSGASALDIDAAPLVAKDAQTRARVIHASADAPAVDIASGDTVLVSGLTYPRQSPFVPLPTTGLPTTTLNVRTAGTTTNLYGVTVTAAVTSASAGNNTTIFALGRVGAAANATDAFRAVAVVDTSATAAAAATTVDLVTTKL